MDHKKETQNSVPSFLDKLGTRISETSKLVGSKKKLAEAAGISESQLYRCINGTSTTTIEPLVAMAKAAGVSMNWLATGEGSMRPGEPQAMPIDESEYAYVPLYDAECSAGHGSWNEGCRVLTNISFTKYSLRKQGLDPKTLSAIRVDGDSMEGVLSDGDVVLIDHSKQEIRGEGVYVLRLDGHLYAKRLQRQLDGVAILSENKAYETMTVPKDRLGELEVIGQVVWSGGWMS